MKCPFCGTKKNAVVFQNRIRWMHRFSCGHINVAGFMMPPDVLIDEGLANPKQEVDPRAAWKGRHDAYRKQVKFDSYDDYKANQEARTTDFQYTPIAKGAFISRKSEK